MPPFQVKKKKWEQDPNAPNQEINRLPGVTEIRNKPEETLRQQALSRVAGNVPLPPETAAEAAFKPKPAVNPAVTEAVDILRNKNMQIPQQNIPNVAGETEVNQIQENKKREFLTGTTGQKIKDVLIGTPTAGGEPVTMGTAPIGVVSAVPSIVAVATKIRALSALTKTFLGLSTSALISKYTLSKRSNVRNATNDFTNAKANIGDIIEAVNKGIYSNLMDAVEDYELQVRAIRKQEQALKGATSTWLQSFLSGGKDDLADVENFLNNEWRYRKYLEQALLKPNPNATIGQETPQEAQDETKN